VGVDGEGVGAVDPGEPRPRRARRRRRQAVGAVDVQPDVVLGADVGDLRNGSTAPVSAVPAVATTATGTIPRLRSRESSPTSASRPSCEGAATTRGRAGVGRSVGLGVPRRRRFMEHDRFLR
jgi:hypothetical protein